jgi:hypothetical protein
MLAGPNVPIILVFRFSSMAGSLFHNGAFIIH